MTRAATWNGAKWCRRTTRLAIYLRDGLACVWCGWAAEDGASLSLDHLVPHILGGTNKTSNLVTACKRCNDTRQATPMVAWSERHGKDWRKVHGRARRGLGPWRVQARVLMDGRGFSEALALAKAKS